MDNENFFTKKILRTFVRLMPNMINATELAVMVIIRVAIAVLLIGSSEPLKAKHADIHALNKTNFQTKLISF